ncbi:MAG: hypothetical protein A3D31_09335 [Candidatus Fluviicola riflensis]|nr:MAG: hypothetical protein CHH17_13745 [Candidatus Fluviicola riflensis]OGS77210.1 MAG: hypothetical protein A3D31_09335 [Candidatus Fluviicola riflensis]OGS82145.1 MAG: hypothetical protein A2724_18280 [Fluviicola sp. RIFCSPHIGHO2_01_FULL_43_53]OGS87839.1 MAG: hypothetical protein A3E30_15715 [Fluviicola sp. RIFCSPHIGHO2_12_FULL_43_24]
MKLPATISGIIAFALTGIFICSCNNPSAPEKLVQSKVTDTKEVINETIPSNALVEARLEAPTVVKVAFAVSGKLEKGELTLEQGTHFKKGQLLYQINNREAFAALNRVKTELATRLVQLMPEIETQFPTEKNKWVRFMEELKPQFLTPSLPAFKTSKERYLFSEKGCLTDYYRLLEMETNMANYFYIAPFDGTVIAILEQPENQIRAGKPIVHIAKKEALHVKSEIPINLLNTFMKQSPLVCTVQGDTIGKAVYKSRNGLINERTQKMRYWFDLKLFRKRPVFHGMKVQLVIPEAQQTVAAKVPLTALKGESVQVLQNGKLIEKQIYVVQSDSDSAFVSGLKSGEKVVVTFQQSVDPKAVYK